VTSRNAVASSGNLFTHITNRPARLREGDAACMGNQKRLKRFLTPRRRRCRGHQRHASWLSMMQARKVPSAIGIGNSRLSAKRPDGLSTRMMDFGYAGAAEYRASRQ
jgi:hypothetical protein